MNQPLQVLIVEDSEDDAALLLRELRRGGYEPQHERVDNAPEMEAALARQRWDLVLSDYAMPQFSGLEALRLVQDQGLDLPFIILSGRIGEDTAVAAMQAGAHDYLMKDNLSRLLPAIARELQKAGERQRRRDAEEAFHILVDRAPLGIFLIQAGRLQMVNPGFCQITGFPAETLVGRDAMHLVAPEFRDLVRANAIRMLKGDLAAPYEFQIITRSGEKRWIMETVTPTQYQGKGAVLGYFMDITAAKVMEGQLVQAQKMEAVGRLASGVAHDFNNLLTAILGFSEFMLAEAPPQSQIAHFCQEITKVADQAADLTRQLLAFGRRQLLQPAVFDLREVVADMQNMLRRVIGEDITLLVRSRSAASPVKADPGQIRQVIMNLAVNARDAMPRGGRLTFDLAEVHLQADDVRGYMDLHPGRYVTLTVRDTGAGMDAETLSHIFEPFFTTKEPGKGTGLGLPTVFGIIKQSHGHILVSSKPGEGTAFTIYLPYADGVIESLPGPAVGGTSLRGSETILVVEDEDILRKVISRALKKFGYKVLEASHGNEALLVCQGYRGDIHLLITDMVMPFLNGPDLARRLKALRPEIAVLYTSGYAENDILLPGQDFLPKPFKPLELVQKVHHVLQARAERPVGAPPGAADAQPQS